MTDRRRSSTHAGAVAVLATLVLVVASCATGSGDLGSVAPPHGTSGPSLDIPSPEPTPGSSTARGSPAATSDNSTTIRAYFMLGSYTGDAGLVPVLRSVRSTYAVGAAAMTQLLAGPVGSELSSSPALYTGIPAATRFLGLDIQPADSLDGIAFVNLSSEFDAGGTSATLAQRYAQVVFTLTQFPTITGVIFEIDGEQTPAVITGGTVDRSTPVNRDFYTDLLPPIWVDRPSWGGALPSGSQVSGTADVFEAQFRLMVLDADGRALTDMPVNATCGTGCRGDFSVKVAYQAAAAQWGTLRVFEPSAKDGSPVNVVDYPVWLTP
jgi:spore germination protein GerM